MRSDISLCGWPDRQQELLATNVINITRDTHVNAINASFYSLHSRRDESDTHLVVWSGSPKLEEDLNPIVI